MSEYVATTHWKRGAQKFSDRKYSRAHEWYFDGGLTVAASASPEVVPLPMSVAENVDPEEAFVASLSSCHLLFFLDLAARAGYIIDEYTDEALGLMENNAAGKSWIAKVVLRPKISFSGDKLPERPQIEALHHRAHELCFIANSVRTEVVTEIVS